MLLRTSIFVHIAAASLALIYAWWVSTSAYVQTGLQFVAPLLVIMAFHLAWIAAARELKPGFAQTVFRRGISTAIGIVFAIVLSNVIMPNPAHADMGKIGASIGGIVFCLAIIAIVVGLVGSVIYILFKIATGLRKRFTRSNDTDNETRLFDFGSIAIAAMALAAASLEGVPNFYAFASTNHATASYHLDQSPDRVWETLETATSPEFPLAGLLQVFPRPVEVTVDEGTALGATRKVKFAGREGIGYLTLKVSNRTDTKATFTVVSDSSPIANWVTHRHLIYQVLPDGAGSRLNVTLEYDRRLAPAWFFNPLTKAAAYLAMDVLARDVKARAQN